MTTTKLSILIQLFWKIFEALSTIFTLIILYQYNLTPFNIGAKIKMIIEIKRSTFTVKSSIFKILLNLLE